jgi:mono/diheme cytochrome c family protein
MRRAIPRLGCWLAAGACLTSAGARAQTGKAVFLAEQIAAGAKLYADHCSVCHGVRMDDPSGGFFDLRTFPANQRSRFFNSVRNGKNSMPPWRSVLTQEQIDSLFAYVVAGEKNPERRAARMA